MGTSVQINGTFDEKINILLFGRGVFLTEAIVLWHINNTEYSDHIFILGGFSW